MDGVVDYTRTVVGSADTPISATPTSSRSQYTSGPGSHHETEGRFPPGTVLNGRYRIIAMLGKGGMGEVYRATDLTLGQSVALKFLPGIASSDPRWLERFHSEVRIARQVSHPNVCRVYDIGETDGLPFLSMEYVDGEDLATLLRRIGRLPADKATEIARKICAGLHAAHDRGIIHRDFKPHNIMLDKRGEVLICDFGLAAVSTELLASEIRQGTPAYMAPEQLKGTEVTAASDIYALGLVLYEVFTGKRAFAGANINELLNQQEAMQMQSVTSLAADVNPAVENIIRRCLDADPRKRPASALAVSAALPGGDPLAAALAAGQTPSPEMVAQSQSENLPRRVSLPLTAAILIGLCFFPFVRSATESMFYTPTDLPPEALAVRAREAAAAFGFTEKPVGTYSSFQFRMPQMDWLRDKVNRDWQTWFHRESPLIFYYRQSNFPVVQHPMGTANFGEPAMENTGDVRLLLDSRGALRYFEANAPRNETVPAVAFDEAKLFTWLKLRRDQFQSTAPFRTPARAFDQRVALRGPFGDLPGTEVTIQYGTWKGRLTSLYLLYPWSEPLDAPRKPETTFEMVRNVVMLAGLAAFVFFSTTLARKNWTLGRADRTGALRLFLLYISLCAVEWVFAARWVPRLDMINFFMNNAASWLFGGLLMWLVYLALEPALRSRWPKSLITWNRLLSGNWMDPQVGSHILTGVAVAVTIVGSFIAKDWIEFKSTGVVDPSSVNILTTRDWIAALFSVTTSGIQSGFIIFFIIFGLRVLLRRELPAIVVGAILMSVTSGDLASSKNLIVDAGAYFLISLAIMFALVRFGLLTTVVTVMTTNMLGRAECTTDFNAWYMPYTVATLVFVAAITLFGFWRSLGNQQIVGDAH